MKSMNLMNKSQKFELEGSPAVAQCGVTVQVAGPQEATLN